VKINSEINNKPKLSVVSEPAQARIIIDGVDSGVKTPNLIELSPGSHHVEVTSIQGHGSKVVDVKEGEHNRVSIPLKLHESGSVRIVSRPLGKKITLDGKPVGTTPLLLDNVPTGNHKIEVVRHPDIEKDVAVKKGEVTEVLVVISSPEESRWEYGIESGYDFGFDNDNDGTSDTTYSTLYAAPVLATFRWREVSGSNLWLEGALGMSIVTCEAEENENGTCENFNDDDWSDPQVEFRIHAIQWYRLPLLIKQSWGGIPSDRIAMDFGAGLYATMPRSAGLTTRLKINLFWISIGFVYEYDFSTESIIGFTVGMRFVL
jgi:hypothetical protein